MDIQDVNVNKQALIHEQQVKMNGAVLEVQTTQQGQTSINYNEGLGTHQRHQQRQLIDQ